MTTVVVVAEPPVEDCVPELLPPEVDAGTDSELYAAMLADVCTAIQHGEGDVLINYPTAEDRPVDDPQELLADALAGAVPRLGDVRYEVQVGETDSGIAGNALSHLLETEEEPTVGVAAPTALFLRREHVGNVAMQLRSHEVVVGPAPNGRVYFAGFREAIDFEDAFAAPAVESVTERGREADRSVSFLPVTPVFEEPSDYETVGSLLRARMRAGRLVPEQTAALFEKWGLIGKSGES